MARSLIICPTFDHADTLFASIASVQAQRDQDWEMVVICDGAPDRTVEILGAISAMDPRVSFQTQPKGERLGEAYRDPVMRESNAEFVCHIGDDDIWSDQHLSTMAAMLRDADFAMQGSLEFGNGGTWAWNFANSGTAVARALSHHTPPNMLVAGLNNFAVRRDAYLKLKRGWTPAPSGVGSDVFMCVQYLGHPNMRIASSSISTFAKLPSRLERHNFTPEQRLVELTPVLAAINSPNYLENARSKAVIGVPVIRAMFYAEAGKQRTLKKALKSIGLIAAAENTAPEPAVNGAIMQVPLTPSQLDQCEMAWLLLRSTVAKRSIGQRLKQITDQGLAWLLTPYLETLGYCDSERSLHISDMVHSMAEQPEIACAFRIRMAILSGRLADAQSGIDKASTLWPNAGWLHVMRTWQNNALARQS